MSTKEHDSKEARSGLFLILLLLPTSVTARPVAAEAARPLVITNATVVDATGAPARPGITIVIRGNRIVALRSAGEPGTPEEADLVDATGKTVIPGLWDMHVHQRDYEAPLYLASGVTGRRIMWGTPRDLDERRQVGTGNPPVLRSSVASPLIDGPNPVWPGSTVVATEEEARRVARAMKEAGYDFLKVYSHLPREAYLALADEARKLGLPFAGHVPEAVSALEASDVGQKSIEHLDGLYLACCSREAALRRWLAEGPRREGATIAREVRAGFDEEKAADFFARCVRNGTWHVPTLTYWRWRAHPGDERITRDPRLRYIPEAEEWERMAARIVGPVSKPEVLERCFQQDLDTVGRMHRAGVRILAGTDAGNPYCMPGFSLHDELELLVRAGLSPMEALQAATRSAAEYMGRLSDLGTVEEGKLADLGLLEADPLADIRSTRAIAAVVFDGKYFPASALAEMLAAAERRGGASGPGSAGVRAEARSEAGVSED